ncbi:hypothetical protein NKH77_11480 [Streptomyces sp. M19]
MGRRIGSVPPVETAPLVAHHRRPSNPASSRAWRRVTAAVRPVASRLPGPWSPRAGRPRRGPAARRRRRPGGAEVREPGGEGGAVGASTATCTGTTVAPRSLSARSSSAGRASMTASSGTASSQVPVSLAEPVPVPTGFQVTR